MEENNKPTEAQIKYIISLGSEHTEEQLKAMTKKEVSLMIDRLRAKKGLANRRML